MSSLFSFIGSVIEFLFFIVIVLTVIALFGYNSLRSLAEQIRESWSNIGVTARKQVSLINQLIEVVKGFQESEKLVMLKVSDDMSSANSVSQMHQQAGMVLSTVSGMARQFPELKSNQQYARLIDSIQACEAQLENARQTYNKSIKAYNTKRSSIPTVFYAHLLGFKPAGYLEFDGSGETSDTGSMNTFVSDDGERVNALLGQAGNKLLNLSSRAIETGKGVTQKAIESGKALAEKHQVKSRNTEAESISDVHVTEATSVRKFCVKCGNALSDAVNFCGSCGTKAG